MRGPEKILLFTHPACLDHRPNDGHPESPARLEVILDALKAFAKREAPLASREDLLLAHDLEMVEKKVFDLIPSDGIWALDGDTIVSKESGRAARYAAGSGIAAVDSILAGETACAFCAVRPPGHHASRKKPGGFCLFNNVAIAALHAMERRGVKRVAIVDFDAHHGNGTQDIFWKDPRVLYVSTHQSPFDPFTGSANEKGAFNNILNIPMEAGTKGTAMRSLFQELVLPSLEKHRPEMLFISAGFDAHLDDPLTGLSWTEDDFGWLGTTLSCFAGVHCGSRVVIMLEGGYALPALAVGAKTFLLPFSNNGKS